MKSQSVKVNSFFNKSEFCLFKETRLCHVIIIDLTGIFVCFCFSTFFKISSNSILAFFADFLSKSIVKISSSRNHNQSISRSGFHTKESFIDLTRFFLGVVINIVFHIHAKTSQKIQVFHAHQGCFISHSFDQFLKAFMILLKEVI
jgi:hypothetical protein